jgi:hypothetical protein
MRTIGSLPQWTAIRHTLSVWKVIVARSWHGVRA